MELASLGQDYLVNMLVHRNHPQGPRHPIQALRTPTIQTALQFINSLRRHMARFGATEQPTVQN